MEKKDNILALIVNYGNWDSTYKCVASLEAQKNIKVIVLDNFFNSDNRFNYEEIIAKIRKSGIEIKFFDENFGYLGACLTYLSLIDTNDYDWFMIMNNDIILDNGNIGEALSQFTKKKQVWAVAPSIKELNGKELNPYFKEPLSIMKKISFRIYYSSYYVAHIMHVLRSLLLPEKIEKSEYNKNIHSMNGAVFILKNELIQSLLKENILSFLYGEEVLVSELVHRSKKEIPFINSLAFNHEHSLTIGKSFTRRKYNWMKNAYYQSLERGFNFYKL